MGWNQNTVPKSYVALPAVGRIPAREAEAEGLHDRILPGRITGTLTFDIVAVDAVRVGSGRPELVGGGKLVPGVVLGPGNQPVIPGSSIKGMLRSLAEALGQRAQHSLDRRARNDGPVIGVEHDTCDEYVVGYEKRPPRPDVNRILTYDVESEGASDAVGEDAVVQSRGVGTLSRDLPHRRQGDVALGDGVLVPRHHSTPAARSTKRSQGALQAASNSAQAARLSSFE